VFNAPASVVSRQVLVIADGHTQTVESVYEDGHAALRHLGEDPKPARFLGQEPSRGLLYDNSKARSLLAWSPTLASFRDYCRRIQDDDLQP
jgi:hypothetical protein